MKRRTSICRGPNVRLRYSFGYTIIELLIGVVLVGIVASFVAPGWQRVQSHAQLRGQGRDFQATLYRARSDAQTRSRLSGVALDSANSRWMRWADSDSDGTVGRYDMGEQVIVPWTPLDPRVEVGRLDCSERSAGICYAVFQSSGQSLTQLDILFRSRGDSMDTLSMALLPATGLLLVRR